MRYKCRNQRVGKLVKSYSIRINIPEVGCPLLPVAAARLICQAPGVAQRDRVTSRRTPSTPPTAGAVPSIRLVFPLVYRLSSFWLLVCVFRLLVWGQLTVDIMCL